MARKRKIKIPSIEGVSAGGTAVLKLPRGPRYHALIGEYNTATAGGPTEVNIEAELTDFRLKINDAVQREFTAAQLFDINRTKGITPTVGASNGYVEILFAEPQRLTHLEREVHAWGTMEIDSIYLEIDIDAGASTPVLSFSAVVDDVPEPPVNIVKWTRNNLQIAASGEFNHALTAPKGESYQGIFLFEGSAGDINSVKLDWNNGVDIYNVDENFQTVFQKLSDFTTVSGLVHLPLDNNSPADAYASVRKLPDGRVIKIPETQMTLDMAAANNVTMIRELIGNPN